MTSGDWASFMMSDGEQRWKAAGRKPKVDKRPEQRRNKVIAGIENVLRQLAGKEDNPRRGWYATKGDLCRVTVRLGARPLPLNGSETHAYIPAERATEFYQGLRTHVEGGGLDEAIASLHDKGGAGVRTRGGRGRTSPSSPGAAATTAGAETKRKSRRQRTSVTVPEEAQGSTSLTTPDAETAPKTRRKRAASSQSTPKPARARRTKNAAGDAEAGSSAAERAPKRQPRKRSRSETE